MALRPLPESSAVERQYFLDDLCQLDGMYVGSLSDQELRDFETGCRLGYARRAYVGGAGFMGLAKVALNRDANWK